MDRVERNGRRAHGVGFRHTATAANRLCVPGSLKFLALLVVMSAVAAASGQAAEFAGQEPLAVRDAIGSGIHAYHAGDFNRAYDDLTNAIEAGADDPRGYYFRGLAALKLGRTTEAEADFTTGADREAATGSMRRVSQSLERVQGHDRLSLERFRSRARLGVLQRDREVYGRRYSTIEDAMGDVRRRRRPEDIQPELVAPRELPGAKAMPPAAVEDVPAPSPAKPGKKVEADPETESDDPFGDEKPRKGMSGGKPAEADDPFGN
jgi:hypothetical protein